MKAQHSPKLIILKRTLENEWHNKSPQVERAFFFFLLAGVGEKLVCFFKARLKTLENKNVDIINKRKSDTWQR